MLSKLRKSILKKLRNSLKSIILSKITLLNEKKENLKSSKDKKDKESDLFFRKIDEKSKRIKRLDEGIN